MKDKVTVVLAFENEDYLQMMKKDLEHYGHIDVMEMVRDGVELVEKVGELHPNVVVADAMLPRKDGLAAVRQITNRGGLSKPAFFLLSSFISEQMFAEAASLGVQYFNPKPCDPESLAQRVEQYDSLAVSFAKPARKVDPDLDLEMRVTKIDSCICLYVNPPDKLRCYLSPTHSPEWTRALSYAAQISMLSNIATK